MGHVLDIHFALSVVLCGSADMLGTESAWHKKKKSETHIR